MYMEKRGREEKVERMDYWFVFLTTIGYFEGHIKCTQGGLVKKSTDGNFIRNSFIDLILRYSSIVVYLRVCTASIQPVHKGI